MSDFRTPLYTHYVSNFKALDSQLSAGALQAYFAWCEYKFLPLLKGLPSEARLLELGCGPGYMLEFLKHRGFEQARGIDLSAEQVELAVRRECQAEVANALDYLEAQEGSLDAVLALDFVEHFRKDELLRLIPLIFRSLRPGGRLILQTPNGQGLFPHQVIYGDLTHLTIFTPSSLQQLLTEAGFQNCRFYETGPAPKNLAGKLRLVLWQLIRALANIVRRIETGKTQVIWTENMICCCERVVA